MQSYKKMIHKREKKLETQTAEKITTITDGRIK